MAIREWSLVACWRTSRCLRATFNRAVSFNRATLRTPTHHRQKTKNNHQALSKHIDQLSYISHEGIDSNVERPSPLSPSLCMGSTITPSSFLPGPGPHHRPHHQLIHSSEWISSWWRHVSEANGLLIPRGWSKEWRSSFRGSASFASSGLRLRKRVSVAFNPVPIDLVITPFDHGWCFAYTCAKRISNFWTYLPTGQFTNIT